MTGTPGTEFGGVFAALRPYARAGGQREQCEFCSVQLGGEHRHLFEPATGKLICVCEPCGLRFENVAGRWKLVPRDARPWPDFHMTDALWESLALPIGLAFFFQSSTAQKVMAIYPSPAGPTESLLPLNGWQALVAGNPGLEKLQPDVEALLVNRLGSAAEYFVTPIDRCFQLVGLIRLHWRGLSGGEQVWRQLDTFFQTLRSEFGKEISAGAQQESRATKAGTGMAEVAHA